MNKLILNQKKIFKKICHQKQTKKKLIEGRLKKNQLIVIFRLFLIFLSILKVWIYSRPKFTQDCIPFSDLVAVFGSMLFLTGDHFDFSSFR